MSLNGFVIILVPLIVPLSLKTVLFMIIFRWRKQQVSLPTSFLLAGAPLILSIIPIPLPGVIAVAAGIGVALYILARVNCNACCIEFDQ